MEKGEAKENELQPTLVVEGLKQAFALSPGQSLVQACQLGPEEQEEIEPEAPDRSNNRNISIF